MNKISIALCTFNGAEFLQEQLESIAGQTRAPDEIMVGDDCSKDKTVEILKKFAANVPFPVCVRVNEQNLGSTKNFEQTIFRCRGDIIFLSDQDDVWMPEKIEKTVFVLEGNKAAGLAFANAKLVDKDLEPLGINLWEVSFTPEEQRSARAGQFLKVLLQRNVVTGATMAFRSELCQNFKPIPTHIPNMIHDAWIALIIAAQAEVEFISEPLIKYRQHSRQQLGINWQNKKRDGRKEESRTLAYTKSISFYRAELERLSALFELLNNNPLFVQYHPTNNNFLEKKREEVQQIIEHYETRVGLSRSRVQRIATIFSEVLSGRYHRFSKGWMSAAKDLLVNL